MAREAQLQNYLTAFEHLTAENLETNLGKCFAEDVYFKDPFNTVTGKQATLHIFKHMFSTVDEPNFTVLSAAQDMQNHQTALLYWKFEFILPSDKSAQKIDGMSRVTFDRLGLVTEHVDYWDAGEQVYAKVPLLGWGIRQVAKRLSASE